MRAELQKKIDQAIRLLQMTAPKDGSPVEVAYSGGKDSDVILQLAKEAGINFEAIYRNTTIDPPGTIKHAEDNGCTIMRPRRYNFGQLIARKGLPSRFRRFCCEELKEYKVKDKCVMGVRRDESKARSDRYHEPTQCRFYGSKKEHVEAIYPILDWSKDDVVDFINDRGIKLHPLYYREDGTIDPTRRLGCMCCPLAARDKRIDQFKAHPLMVRFYLRNLAKFYETHPNAASVRDHDSIYANFVHDVFYPGSQEWQMVSDGLFGKPDCKAFLEDYFKIKLD